MCVTIDINMIELHGVLNEMLGFTDMVIKLL
jgi:hypothetical protein